MGEERQYRSSKDRVHTSKTDAPRPVALQVVVPSEAAASGVSGNLDGFDLPPIDENRIVIFVGLVEAPIEPVLAPLDVIFLSE